MAGLIVALKLLVAHFAADFLLQTWPVAAKKGKRLRYLLLHIAILFITTVALFVYELGRYLASILILTLVHGGIDLVTSRKLPANWKTLMADQALHWLSIIAVAAWVGGVPWHRISQGLREFLSDGRMLVIGLGYLVSMFFGSILVERICDQFDNLARAAGGFKERIPGRHQEDRGAAGVLQGHGGNQDGLRVVSDPEVARMEDAAGTFIGIVERFLVTTFIIFGQYGAVGYVFAAKSIGKFAEQGGDGGRRQRFPAYYLVGTLASFAVAVVAGLAVNRLLQVVK